MAKKPAIFEEVEAGQTPAATPGVVSARSGGGARRGIRIWLFILAVMLVAMIAVGGLTRLTDSGLSITEWKPVTGAIPPLNAADWQSEFAKYQASPEFQLQNSAMTLSEFKFIYFWEWSHRLLGRLIGLVWAVGFFWFLLRRQIPVGWTGRLASLGLLGGLQGAVGWWMVSSGLTGRMVDVASYRLAIHLGIAFVILGLIGWYAMLLGRDQAALMQARRAREARLGGWATALGITAFAQILLGALVAGIDAGRSFPTWPSMNGEFLPSESFDYQPLWSNFFENPALVQFDHRMLGYTLLVLTLVAWGQARKSAHRRTRGAFNGLLVVTVLQMILGIGTAVMAAPWHIAIVHQFGAVMVLMSILAARFNALYPTADGLRGK